jgi:hypothetical protein
MAWNPRIQRLEPAARVLWEIVKDQPWPNGLELRHKCGQAWCMNIDHVEPSDHAINMADQYTHATRAIGSRQLNAKLNEQAVVDILVRIANGESQAALADEYRVSRATICGAWTGRRWAHVDGPRRPAKVAAWTRLLRCLRSR